MLSYKSEDRLREACEGTLYEYIPGTLKPHGIQFDYATGATALFIYLRKRNAGLDVFKEGPLKVAIMLMEQNPEMIWDLSLHNIRENMVIGKRICIRLHKHRLADTSDILVGADFISRKKNTLDFSVGSKNPSFLPDPDQIDKAEEPLVEKALECLDYEKRMGRASKCSIPPFDPQILEKAMNLSEGFFKEMVREPNL